MKKTIILLVISLIPISVFPAIMGLMKSLDEPAQGFSDNWVGDIASHKGAIWLRTGRGMSFTLDGGVNWQYYDNSNGLLSNDPSAFWSDDANGRLWVAINHWIGPETDPVPYSDGLVYTDDEGLTWNLMESIVREIDTALLTGPNYTIYDITGYDSLIFCASWAGGLFGSFDGGQTWRNIYYSLQDSVLGFNSLSNLYFSAVLDTFHTDSIVLWAGTADGLMRYVWAPAYAKPSSNKISDITHFGDFTYISGDSGLSIVQFDTSRTFSEIVNSAFTSDGLPGLAVTTAYSFGGRLFAGTADTLNGSGTGLAISDDNGASFHTNYTGLQNFLGPKRLPREFAAVGANLFMAGWEGGLYFSSDTGDTWQRAYADTLDTTLASGRNIIYSLAADSLNLWVGTDSGLVLLYLNSSASVDSSRYFVFPENDSSGARSYRVRVQKFSDGSGGFDSTAIWVINHPRDTTVGEYSVYRSNDYGQTWVITSRINLVGLKYNDIAFSDSVVYLAGKQWFNSSPNGVTWFPKEALQIRDSLNVTINFGLQDLRTLEVVNDTIYVGCDHGVAISPAGSNNWHIITANTNPLKFDKVNKYTSAHGLTGNFITALGIQSVSPGNNSLWITCQKRPNTLEEYGIVSGPLDGQVWTARHTGTIAWNYAFSGSNVLAATDSGLLFSANSGLNWQNITITGILANSERPVPYTINQYSPAYAAYVDGDTLWVGTGDGAAKIALDDIGLPDWNIFRVYDPTSSVYAYPVPFSPYSGGTLKFHYPVPSDARATLKIYDFAMNLVKSVIDGEMKPGGPNVVSSTDQWDGYNGKGEVVAAGFYYFKVELSTGQVYWGKLAIIP